jgi:hypothetical protein
MRREHQRGDDGDEDPGPMATGKAKGKTKGQ